MSLFDSFTAPKWQHKNPDVRKTAVKELEDQEVLLQLIKTDPDRTVQSAALSRISNPELLGTLAESLTASLQQQARNQLLQHLLPNAESLGSITDDALLLRIASLSDNIELSANAISRIRSETLRVEIASNHVVAKVRLNAAQGITNIETLNQLMQLSRGQDKGVYRHCKALVDEHNERLVAEAEQQSKIQQLLDRASKLDQTGEAAELEGHFQFLTHQWPSVEPAASPAQQLQFQTAIAACSQRLEQMAAARAAQDQAQIEKEEVRHQFTALLAELESLDAGTVLPLDSTSNRELKTALEELEHRWQAAEKGTGAGPADAQAFTSGLEKLRCVLSTSQNLLAREPQLVRLMSDAQSADATDFDALNQQRERLTKFLGKLPWPDAHKDHLPAPITQLHQAIEQLNTQLTKLESDQQKYATLVHSAIETTRTHLETNHSKEAGRAYAKARRALKSLGAKQRHQFEPLLKPLAAQLHDVHEWQEFAIEPKKIELCASMTALIGSEEDVELLAMKIQSLQDEWKQLGGLPHAREQVLWLEFKAAADEAWKPCKAAFAQQAKLHRERYKQRMQLVAQLQAYDQKMAWPEAGDENAAAGPAPDWRLVQKTLDAARETFRNIKPVDHKGDRASQKAFRAICDQIYSHIKREYERNISRKQALVTQASELAAQEDLHRAIEQAKRLQQEWKATGITPVAADKKLWTAFRAACDAVFARLDEQRVQNQAETDSQVKQAEALRDQARALLAAEPDAAAPSLIRSLSELKQQLHTIALPRPVQQRLTRDFQEMERTARDAAEQEKLRREKAVWTHLLQKLRACALKTADAAAAAELWQNDADVPKGIEVQPLEDFWQHGPGEQSDEDWRDACIALEVTAGVDSPPEDKQARMNYQMRRLVEGMGSQAQEPQQAQLTSINAFIELRPALPWVERFCSTLEKITL